MMSSALRGFEGMGAGPSMYQIGYSGGPGGSIAEAMGSTIDKYEKSRLLNHEYALKQQVYDSGANKALETEKWKLNQAQPNISLLDKWNIDPALPENQVKVGDVTLLYQPVYDKYGNKIGKKLINPRAPNMWDTFGGSNTGGADDEVLSSIQELQALKGQMAGGV